MPDYHDRFKPNKYDTGYSADDADMLSDDELIQTLHSYERMVNKNTNRPDNFGNAGSHGQLDGLNKVRKEYYRRGLHIKSLKPQPATALPSLGASPKISTKSSGEGSIGTQINAPTPKPWGVGAMGGQMRQMNPRMLMQLLQAKMQQKMVQDKQRQMAEQAMAKQAQQAQIIGMMSPEEQRDAKMFGLKYVADRRKARESQGAIDRRFLEGQLRSDARTGARMGAADARTAEKDALSKMLLGNTVAEVEGRAPQQTAQGQFEANAAQPAMQAMQGMGPGGQQAAGLMQQHFQQANQKKIIQKAEWDVIQKAQIAAGRSPTVPPGFVLEEELQQQNQDFAKKQQEAERNAAFSEFVQQGGNPEEIALAEKFVQTGDKPNVALKKVVDARDKKRKEEEAAAKAAKAVESKDETASEARRKELRDLAAAYNAALESAKDTELGVEAKPAARAKVVELREKLKAEGVTIPDENKPVNIYDFKKGAAAPSKGGGDIESLIKQAQEMEAAGDRQGAIDALKKVKALRDGQNVSAKPETIADDQAMGDLRLTAMRPTTKPRVV